MESKLPLSVVVLTKNEEQNIKDCLLSINGWVEEILIVDSGSTDDTLNIAADFTDKIYHHPFENYSLQRNWSQENLPIRNDWIFHLDADERVTSGLLQSLSKFFNDQDRRRITSGLMVRRSINFMGRQIRYGGVYPTYHCRIYRKEDGYCESRAYDQHFVVDGKIDLIPEDLIEVTATSLESWTARHNRWAQLEARYQAERKNDQLTGELQPAALGSPIQRRRWQRVKILERSPLFLRAFAYFLYRYILRGGFLDGKEGLIYHVLHGFWFRFYIDSCIYELKQHKNDHIHSSQE